MSKRIIVSIAVVLIGGAWTFHSMSEREPERSLASRPAPRVVSRSGHDGEARRQLAAMQAELDGLRLQLRGLKDEDRARAVADASDVALPTEAPEAGAARERAQEPERTLSDTEIDAREVQSRRKRFQDVYDAQDRDDAWASAEESRIVNHFAEADVGENSVDDVECRTHECRFVIRHEGHDSRRKASRLFGREPFVNGSYTYYDEETNSTVAFVGRSGHDFGALRAPTDDAG